jgi:hypothetical protein
MGRNKLRELMCPTREQMLKHNQCVFNMIIKSEKYKSCGTCRNKTVTFHDDREGDVCKCDLGLCDSFVNTNPHIENCSFWSRDARVYEWYKEIVNKRG